MGSTVVFCGFVRDISFRKEVERIKEAEREQRLRMEAIEAEKKRSEELIVAMLPEAIRLRLRDGDMAFSENFADASILFLDLVQFTPLSTKMSPELLLRTLNVFFGHLEEIASCYPNVEKVKAIGDSLMLVAGVPVRTEDHLLQMMHCAMDMLEFVGAMEPVTDSNGVPHKVAVRIGIHSGPLTAGIIGTRRFMWDVYGESVAIASRMESASLPNMITVSDTCYNEMQTTWSGIFSFQDRGQVQIKGKGAMRLWFFTSRKSAYAKKESTPRSRRESAVFGDGEEAASAAEDARLQWAV